MLGPSPRTADGNILVLVISDRFTKLSRTVALPDHKARTIVAACIDHWVSAHRIPAERLFDEGSIVTSNFVASVPGLLRIEPTQTSDYPPQTHEQVERFNYTCVNMLMCYVADHTNTSDRILSMVTLAYNARPHRSTETAPLKWAMAIGLGSLFLPPGRVRTSNGQNTGFWAEYRIKPD